MNIEYFREPFMNIVTIKAEYIHEKIAKKYDLVPQQHDANNKWYKIVLMDHVEVEHLTTFMEDLMAINYAQKRLPQKV
jgi:hypothetical protein